MLLSSIRPDPEHNEVLDAQGIITSYHITSIPLIDQCRIGKSNSRHRLPRKAAVGGFPIIQSLRQGSEEFRQSAPPASAGGFRHIAWLHPLSTQMHCDLARRAFVYNAVK